MKAFGKNGDRLGRTPCLSPFFPNALGLHAEPAQLSEEFQARVTIRSLIAGRPARVRFVLNQTDFALACDALRDQRAVTVTGVLQRHPTAKRFDLLQAAEFPSSGGGNNLSEETWLCR